MSAEREHVAECLAFARIALHWRDSDTQAERAARFEAAAAAAAVRRAARQQLIDSRQLIDAPGETAP